MKPTPRTASYDNVYEPFEDSFFLLDCLESEEKFLNNRFKSPFVLEIGCGSGVVTSFIPQLLTNNYIPMACDISPAACKCTAESWDLNWKPLNKWLEVIRGSLVNWLRPKSVDIVVFNPPYVPSPNVPSIEDQIELDVDNDKWVDFALDGGDDGMEVTNKVLVDLDRVLNDNGVAYLLFCAQNKPELVCDRMRKLGFGSHMVDKRRAGREMLSVYKFERINYERINSEKLHK